MMIDHDHTPDGADSPAPDKIIIFFAEDNTYLNSEAEDDGDIEKLTLSMYSFGERFVSNQF